jgi:peptide/nickel transport system substrate-binding protein
MNEHDLHGLIDDVRRGKLSRRAFTRGLVALGLTAPMATQMLAFSGVAVAAEQPAYKPTKRGGGGPLKVLWWQAPTLLNPHFATGTKDQDASRLFYEPLAGTLTAIWYRCSPRQFPRSRTADWPRMVRRSPGNSGRV